MDTQNEKLRKKLMELYGLDINESKTFFSTRNYAFIFPNKPNMIRVTVNGSKTREETLSEVLWLDDLKQFANTICTPIPSLLDHLVEDFQLEGESYRATMFRTAMGNIREVNDFDPMYFICVGECLGRIHVASADANKQGFKFKRKYWTDLKIPNFDKPDHPDNRCPVKICERLIKDVEQIKAIEENPCWFGMIHGDFNPMNFFVDGNNVWTFDFDDCCYGYFMNDIANAIATWLMMGYPIGENKTRRQALYEDILPYFKIGYELHMKLPEEQWSKLELFLDYQACSDVYQVSQFQTGGLIADLEKFMQCISIPLSCPDILDGYDVFNKAMWTDASNSGVKMD